LPSACAKKIPDEQKSDAELFLEATAYFENEDYDLAIQKYKVLKNQHPTSSHVITAEFQIGESHYQLGEWIEAASSFELFEKMHPRDEKAPTALHRIGLSYRKEAPNAIDRDQQNREKALKFFNRLLGEFPSYPQISEVKSEVTSIRRVLAERIITIGHFYFKRKKWKAALDRYKDVVSTYSDLDYEEEMFNRIGLCYQYLNESEKAKQVWEGYVQKYPDGKFKDTAQKYLEKAGDKK
jgi:outer membrane protein assembly factor BamD